MTTEAIWDTYANEVLMYFESKVGDHMTAEDLRQDVFLKIHRNLNSLNSEEKAHNWLTVISRNTLVDFYKSKSKTIDENEVLHQIETDDFLNKSATRCLNNMIAKLPEKYSTPLRKSDLDGEKQSAIAQELGLSISGAKSRIQRGRGLLKEAILNCCEVKLNQRSELVDANCQNEACDC